MGIPFEKLAIPVWEGTTPARVERAPCALGDPDAGGCLIDPPVVLSPMAAVTNPPFRLLCREMGAGMVVTEMINARLLVENGPEACKWLDLRPEEHPVSVQLYGKDPETLAAAARIVEQEGANAVDLNMGCPMKKVTSSGYGAALLEDPGKVYEIFSAMSEAVAIPVTGKMRAGWEESSAVEVALEMERAGAAGITIHGRTRSEGYNGHADLQVIRDLVESVQIPVIGNGDVRDHITARRMFSITGCAAVMVARGALGNPWVFREIAADLAGEPVPERPSPTEKAALIGRHVDLYVETFGEKLATLELRKHLLWYFRGTSAERVLRSMLSGIDSRAAIDEAIAAAVEVCDRDLVNGALERA